jgi:hypothetical protein
MRRYFVKQHFRSKVEDCAKTTHTRERKETINSYETPRQGLKQERRVTSKYNSYFELETLSTCVRNMKKAPLIKGAEAK